MKLATYRKAADFLADAQEFLEQDELVHGLMLGVCLRLKELGDRVKTAPFLATVRDEQGIVVAAHMTPPIKLVITSERTEWGEALHLIAENLIKDEWPCPGVLGPNELPKAFADTWASLTGQSYREGIPQRVFKLTEVIRPEFPPGRFRIATLDDLETVAQWSIAFDEEALHGESGNQEEIRAFVTTRLKNSNFFLWENEEGKVVSMAARARPTPHGESVNAVYTPPDERGKGYASAVVAALSQLLLDEGRQFTTLFTDLTNPTSNSIYQKLGYRPVCDFNEYFFNQQAAQ